MGKLLEIPSPSVAGSNAYHIDKVYYEYSDDEGRDLNDAGSTHRGSIAVCARKSRVSLRKMQTVLCLIGLCVPNTVLGFLPELAVVFVAVTTSSALASSSGAFLLSSQN